MCFKCLPRTARFLRRYSSSAFEKNWLLCSFFQSKTNLQYFFEKKKTHSFVLTEIKFYKNYLVCLVSYNCKWTNRLNGINSVLEVIIWTMQKLLKISLIHVKPCITIIPQKATVHSTCNHGSRIKVALVIINIIFEQ